MAEFHFTERANMSPTVCWFCNGHEGPFVDAMMEDQLRRRVYICIRTPENPGCALQIAREAGGLDPRQRLDLENKLSNAHRVNDELTTKVAELEGTRTINVSDLEGMGFIVRRPAGRPPKVSKES